MLSFANPDLRRLMQGVLALARDSSEDAKTFRSRVIAVKDDPSTWLRNPPERYSQELSLLISEYALGARP